MQLPLGEDDRLLSYMSLSLSLLKTKSKVKQVTVNYEINTENCLLKVRSYRRLQLKRHVDELTLTWVNVATTVSQHVDNKQEFADFFDKWTYRSRHFRCISRKSSSRSCENERKSKTRDDQLFKTNSVWQSKLKKSRNAMHFEGSRDSAVKNQHFKIPIRFRKSAISFLH